MSERRHLLVQRDWVQQQADREASRERMLRHYRGELADGKRRFTSVRRQAFLEPQIVTFTARDGEPIYIGDRLVTPDGETGVVADPTTAPEVAFDNGYNVLVQFGNGELVWMAPEYLLHERVFTSIHEVEDYLNQ